MRRLGVIAALAGITAIVAIAVGIAASSGQAAPPSNVISVLGVARVGGQDVLVDVLAVVPPGRDGASVAAQVLREQGARPAQPSELSQSRYVTSGLVWDQFSDGAAGNNFVTQYYNPAGDVSGGGAAALQSSEATWSNVATSSFAFQYGGLTSRCPSLVKECSGPQRYDSNNDVGWKSIGGCCTLGVTWYSTSRDEADMALNTNFSWHTGCSDVGGSYDTQTVFTHENGHVVGLSHSNDPNAVMYAYYSGARCQLAQDDMDGVSFLYPSGGPPSPTATPTAAPPTPTPTAGGPAPTSTPCPAGWYRNGRC
ncbi:MAG: matrixin family metalloprotease [Dehalococcoidia bacterium]